MCIKNKGGNNCKDEGITFEIYGKTYSDNYTTYQDGELDGEVRDNYNKTVVYHNMLLN